MLLKVDVEAEFLAGLSELDSARVGCYFIVEYLINLIVLFFYNEELQLG